MNSIRFKGYKDTVKRVELSKLITAKAASKLGPKSISGDGYTFYNCSKSDYTLKHKDYMLDGEFLVVNKAGSANFALTDGKFSYSEATNVFDIDRSNLHPQYIYNYLMDKKDMVDNLLFKGLTIKKLDKAFYKLQIPIPSIPEQVRISNFIENYKEVIKLKEIEIIKLEEYTKKVIHDTFKKLTKNKETYRLGDILEEMPKSKLGAKSISGDGYMFYNSSTTGYSLKHKDYMLDGEFLVVNTGGGANFALTDGKFSYSPHNLVYKATTNEITLPIIYLNLMNKKDYINKVMFKGTALKHLDRGLFNNFEISKINKDDQDKIENLVRECKKLLDDKSLELKHLKDIYKGIQRKLFTFTEAITETTTTETKENNNKKKENTNMENITEEVLESFIEYHNKEVFSSNENDCLKVVHRIERVFRSSAYYKQWKKIIKDSGFNSCRILDYNAENLKVEIHHVVTLFELTRYIGRKQVSEGIKVTDYTVLNELMHLHLDFKIPLIALSTTCHELVHSGHIKLHRELLDYDDWDFYEIYKDYITEDEKSKIEQFRARKTLTIKTAKGNVIEIEPSSNLLSNVVNYIDNE